MSERPNRQNRQLAHYGVRLGDMPFAFHDNGTAAMYHALMRGERGQIAEFDVVNAAEWSAGRDKSAFRRARVQPHGTVADEELKCDYGTSPTGKAFVTKVRGSRTEYLLPTQPPFTATRFRIGRFTCGSGAPAT